MSLHCLSLRPGPRAYVCRRFPWRRDPHFSALDLHPGPCQTLGGLPLSGPSVSPILLPLPPWVLLWIISLSGCGLVVGCFFAWGREARAPPLPISWSPWPSPPLLLGHDSTVQDTRLPIYLPPLFVLIPSQLVESVGHSAISWLYTRM